MIKAEKINHKKAQLRVNGNIALLKSKEQTLKSIYDVIFSRPDFTYLNIVNSYGVDEVTYKEAKHNINVFAKYFVDNLNSNHKYVAILLDNSKEWIYSFFGLLLAGFTPVLLSTANDIKESENVIKTLEIRTILTNKAVDELAVNTINPFEIKSSVEEHEIDSKFANEIVFLTSGTTGTPKIVFYKGEQLCKQIYNAAGVLNGSKIIDKTEKGYFKLLAVLPFYHVFGLIVVLLWFSFFNITIILPNGVNPKSIKQACALTRPTHIFAVPLFWESINTLIKLKCDTEQKKNKLKKAFKWSFFLQKHFGAYGTHLVRERLFKKYLNEIFGTSIRFCISGGAFIDQEALQTINLLGYPLVNGYGSTEIGIVSLCDSNLITQRLSTSIGKPFNLVEFKVEDNHLMVKAESASKHIIDKNHEQFLSKDEWIDTKDLVRVENGGYFLIGRDDEIIIQNNGENLSLPLLEKQLKIPHAKEFAIVEEFNKLSLVVSYAKFTSINLVIEELNNIGKQKVSKYISNICFTNVDFPKANTIKIKRDELKKLLEKNRKDFIPLKLLKENKDRIISSTNMELLESVKDVFRRLFPKSEVTADSHYYNDLGGDSLRYFILVSEIEQKIGKELSINYENPPYSPKEFVKLIEKMK